MAGPLPTSRLLISTGNSGKMREYQSLLQNIPFELVSLRDLGITHEVDETGDTFEQNALLKASEYADISGMLTLADDSGLEVDALHGEPGVRSARYGGDSCTSDEGRVALLLKNLAGVAWEARTARFRCVIAIVAPAPDHPHNGTLLAQAEGSVAGMIQYEPQGDDGFGYDRVFYLPSYSKTIAQLPLDVKNKISHRANAASKAVETLIKLKAES